MRGRKSVLPEPTGIDLAAREIAALANGPPHPAPQGTLHPVKIENAEQRRQRLAAELRANLVKRKAQARARAEADTAQLDAGQIEAGPGENVAGPNPTPANLPPRT